MCFLIEFSRAFLSLYFSYTPYHVDGINVIIEIIFPQLDYNITYSSMKPWWRLSEFCLLPFSSLSSYSRYPSKTYILFSLLQLCPHFLSLIVSCPKALDLMNDLHSLASNSSSFPFESFIHVSACSSMYHILVYILKRTYFFLI